MPIWMVKMLSPALQGGIEVMSPGKKILSALWA
jgi:hypothetical protein